MQNQIRITSTIKVYCTTQCQKEATKKKRRVSRVSRATNSAFLYHLAYECERAGALQILRFHSVESLVALYEVYKLKLRSNRYGECKDFEISHNFLTEPQLQALFDVLHGKLAGAFLQAVGAVSPGAELIPVLLATLAMPTAKPGSFADELDWPVRVPDVAPIFRSNSFV